MKKAKGVSLFDEDVELVGFAISRNGFVVVVVATVIIFNSGYYYQGTMYTVHTC